MLPVVSNIKTKLISGAVAVALLATSAAPALAWQGGNGHGRFYGGGGYHGGGYYHGGGNYNNNNNNGLILGTGLGLLLGYGLGSANNTYRQPVYAQPVYPAPVYRAPVYAQPVYPQQPVYQTSIYNTPAAYAFQNYSWNERRRIQASLSNFGYYHGGLDGNFGPGTYDALSQYARNTGRLQFLGSQSGSAQLLDGLLG